MLRAIVALLTFIPIGALVPLSQRQLIDMTIRETIKMPTQTPMVPYKVSERATIEGVNRDDVVASPLLANEISRCTCRSALF